VISRATPTALDVPVSSAAPVVPQALDALDLVPEEQQDAVLQLRGQLCYRLGQNQACMDAYNQLTQLVRVGVV
jgi:hypothetical protein